MHNYDSNSFVGGFMYLVDLRLPSSLDIVVIVKCYTIWYEHFLKTQSIYAFIFIQKNIYSHEHI